MPPRRTLVHRPPLLGRHESFRQVVDGEYFFAPYDGPVDGASLVAAYNESTTELQDIIAECVALGMPLRARGALWALSKVAVNDGRLINTTALTQAFRLNDSQVVPNYPAPAGQLRFVECGNSIGALNRYLFREGLSIKTSGANNGQTLAGAISTGTHGSAFNIGSIHDTVVGLHLVVAADRHIYLERASYPVVAQNFIDAFGMEHVKDDALFNAALISFGSFGIIKGLMIETRPLFVLRTFRFYHPNNAAIAHAIDLNDFSQIALPAAAAGVPTHTPHHFELITNPNLANPPGEVVVLLMYEDTYNAATYSIPEWDDGSAGPGAGAIDRMGSLLERLPSVLDGPMRALLNAQMRDEYPPMSEAGIIRDLFRGEKLIGKALATAAAVPGDRAREALQVCYDRYEQDGEVLPVLISLRRVKGTQATLGYTRFADSALVEIDGVNNDSCRRYVSHVWSDFQRLGIPFTVHWGKWNDWLTATRVRQLYGDAAVDGWIAARETLLPDPALRSSFENQFMRNLGLDS